MAADMRLAEWLHRDLVIHSLKAENKLDALTEFAEAVHNVYQELPKDTVTHILLEREKLGSTGIQDGIAIPHGKLKGLDRIVIAFGRSKKGIDFQAHDNKPTHLFFVLLAPETTTGVHLKMLARLSRLLQNSNVRERLVTAKDGASLYQILMEEDEKT